MSGDMDVRQSCPRCAANFINSSVRHESKSTISLHCRPCNEDYDLQNTPQQREYLNKEYAAPSQIEMLHDVRQIAPGDLIAYNRVAYVLRYQHFAIVVDVNYSSLVVRVVEFSPDLPLKSGNVEEASRHFGTDIAQEDAWVLRYMPLDCLPVDQVLQKAQGFITDRGSRPQFDGCRRNNQHLTIWCKTGEMKHQENAGKRWYYNCSIHGFHVFSIYPDAEIAIGTDRSHRGRLASCDDGKNCSEFDLIENEMKSSWETARLALANMATAKGVGWLALYLQRQNIFKPS